MEITSSDPASAVRDWFAALSECCARVDYSAARGLIAPDVVSFGTKAEIVTGADALQEQQWERIWPNIADFRIDLESVDARGSGHLAWGAALWSSTGFRPDGTRFHRPGRATVILERRPALTAAATKPPRVWVAVHTHFSIFPGIPHETFGSSAR